MSFPCSQFLFNCHVPVGCFFCWFFSVSSPAQAGKLTQSGTTQTHASHSRESRDRSILGSLMHLKDIDLSFMFFTAGPEQFQVATQGTRMLINHINSKWLQRIALLRSYKCKDERIRLYRVASHCQKTVRYFFSVILSREPRARWGQHFVVYVFSRHGKSPCLLQDQDGNALHFLPWHFMILPDESWWSIPFGCVALRPITSDVLIPWDCIALHDFAWHRWHWIPWRAVLFCYCSLFMFMSCCIAGCCFFPKRYQGATGVHNALQYLFPSH